MLSFVSILWPIKFIIGKHYRESAARILLRPCAVMLRTRTVIMAENFVRILAIIFAVFVLETASFIFHLERNASNG